MKKYLVLATVAFAVAGSSLGLAHQQFGRQDRPTHARLNPGDIAAFTDARVAALKAGLQLTPDQAKNWPAFEQAYRNLAKLRSERVLSGRSQTPDDQDSVTRLQRRADRISQFGTALQDLAKTERPLFDSLSDAQKRRFGMLAHLQRRHRHFGMWQHDDRGRGLPDSDERRSRHS